MKIKKKRKVKKKKRLIKIFSNKLYNLCKKKIINYFIYFNKLINKLN